MCIFSFPGIYEKEWEDARSTDGGGKLTAGAEEVGPMSAACVFFPDAQLDDAGNVVPSVGHDFFGKHGTPCHCRELYEQLPCFGGWVQGKAPFGCLWFERWIECVQEANGK